MRKEAGFEIADRITTFYQAQGLPEQVFSVWAEYLKAETLSSSLISGEFPEGSYQEEHNLDGQQLRLAVKRNPS
jgi:hypothetical protein